MAQKFFKGIKMIEWFLVRHGETVWNQEGRLQGHLDSELSENGINSAKKLNEYFGEMNFDAVFTSPSGRAVKTLKIALNPSKFVEDSRLKEIALGDWQGMKIEDIKKQSPEQFYDFFNAPTDFYKEDAESFEALRQRVLDFVSDIIDAYYDPSKKTRILVVTHGVTLMMFINIFMNQPFERLWVEENAKPRVFIYDEKGYRLNE